MTASKHGRKALKVACAVAGALVVVTGISAAYCDNNLHAEERLIARALDVGFQEKQTTVNGATVNYAEGPNNGPAREPRLRRRRRESRGPEGAAVWQGVREQGHARRELRRAATTRRRAQPVLLQLGGAREGRPLEQTPPARDRECPSLYMS